MFPSYEHYFLLFPLLIDCLFVDKITVDENGQKTMRQSFEIVIAYVVLKNYNYLCCLSILAIFFAVANISVRSILSSNSRL